jgi:hypothetical protein
MGESIVATAGFTWPVGSRGLGRRTIVLVERRVEMSGRARARITTSLRLDIPVGPLINL